MTVLSKSECIAIQSDAASDPYLDCLLKKRNSCKGP